MIKFDVLHRITRAVQFTAEIDCPEDENYGVKLGLAVKWAIETGSNLRGSNLKGANLRGADLAWANMAGADLSRANLSWADLRGVDLSKADLSKANLSEADLSEADLSWTDLRWTNLVGANLMRASLRVLQTDRYTAYIQRDYIQIGCELHKFDEWVSFDDRRIIEMEGRDALSWWQVWKPIILSIRETIPSETGGE